MARIEFLLCGSPNDAFYSQIAFFRLSLDALGARAAACRVVAALGAAEYPPIPDRWEPFLERVEVVQTDPEAFRRAHWFAAGDLRYELLDPRADLSCLCDADTALLRFLPDDFVEEMRADPAIAGVMAHHKFPVRIDGRTMTPPHPLHPGMDSGQAWESVAQAVLGRELGRPYQYTLVEPGEDGSCPFYPNYGFIAGPPRLLERLHRALRELQPQVASLVRNGFYGQIAIALATDRDAIPSRSLPMRFNFPNEPLADCRYPEELEQIVLLHYLRTKVFDRHRVFVDAGQFERFLSLELSGSNRIFQNHVRKVTGGEYPFSS